MKRWFTLVLLVSTVVYARETEQLAPDEELYMQGATAFDRGDFGVAATNFDLLLKRHPSSSLVCPTFFALSETYYSLQQYSKALSHIERITPTCSQQIGKGRVNWRKAWILYHLDRLEAAGAAFRNAYSSNDLPQQDRVAAMVMVGDVAMELGRVQEALTSYRRASEGNVSSQLACQINLKIGKANLGAGDHRLAIRAFDTVLELDSDSEFADDALYFKAWALRSSSRKEAARIAWRDLIARFPYSPLVAEARFRMGDENYKMGKYQDAVLAFESVPASSDFADDALYWKAWARYRIGEYSRAAYDFGMVRTNFPQSPMVHDAQFRAAEAHREAGEYELALRGFRVVVESKPQEAYLIQSLYGLAQSAAMSGDQAAAENYRTQLLATGRAGDFAPRVFFDMGVAAYNRKQYSRAVLEFSSLLRDYPDHGLVDEALYELGLCYMREEQYGEAIKSFRQCIKRAPTGDAGRSSAYQLGWAHFRAGEYDRSAEQFLRVAGRGGEQAAIARYRAGDAYYNGGRYLDAIAIYQQVIDTAPGTEIAATAQNSIGWCYERLGRPEEAVGAFQVVVDRYPRSGVWDDSAYKIAEFYQSSADYSISVPVLEQLSAVRSSPFWESSLLMLSEGLWHLGRKDQSYETLRTLLDREESPLRPDALLLMADNNWEDKKWEEAAGFYVEFAEGFPVNELTPLALLRVAQAKEAQELWEQASRAYVRASIAGADPVACLGGQCTTAANLTDCDAAETAARSLESRYPAHEETGKALFMAGNCYFAAGNDAKAVKLLLKVPILYPDSDSADDALLAVARARLRQGQPKQAENQLRVLLEKYPVSPLRAQAERLLVSVEGGGQ